MPIAGRTLQELARSTSEFSDMCNMHKYTNPREVTLQSGSLHCAAQSKRSASSKAVPARTAVSSAFSASPFAESVSKRCIHTSTSWRAAQ